MTVRTSVLWKNGQKRSIIKRHSFRHSLYYIILITEETLKRATKRQSTYQRGHIYLSMELYIKKKFLFRGRFFKNRPFPSWYRISTLDTCFALTTAVYPGICAIFNCCTLLFFSAKLSGCTLLVFQQNSPVSTVVFLLLRCHVLKWKKQEQRLKMTKQHNVRLVHLPVYNKTLQGGPPLVRSPLVLEFCTYSTKIRTSGICF